MLLTPAYSSASTFSAPLSALVGPIDFLPGRGNQEANFDFGQEFAEIESVSIEIEAHVIARELDVCGTVFNPQPCTHEVQLLGLFAIMNTEDSPTLETVFSDALAYSDDYRDLEGSGIAVESFNNLTVGWDFLLDGQGSLTLFWSRLLGNPDRIIQNVVEPSGEIFSARLIVEATPIPEPSATVLIGLGLLGLSAQRRSEESSERRYRVSATCRRE